MVAGTMLTGTGERNVELTSQLGGKRLGQYSHYALRLVPTVARVKTYKDDLYLFPPSKLLAVPWDGVQQTGLRQSPESPVPPWRPAAGVSSQLELMGKGNRARNRNVLIQV